MQSSRGLGVAAAAAVLLSTSGCAGPSRAFKQQLDDRIASRDWPAAEADLDARKDSEYGEKNAVLYYLDKAAVLHYAGKYQESDALLDSAEQRIDELYTRSASKVAGTYLLNDNAEPYAGEPHERALLHVLRALNHVFMGRHEGAVVEARKVSAYLAELHDGLETKPVYRDDAFAHYLSALLFEDAGRVDDARISLTTARSAYEWYASDYGTSVDPISDPLADADAGEIVLLHYNGRAPGRGSETIQVAWSDALAAVHATGDSEKNAQVKNALVAGIAGNAVTVAFPAFVQAEYVIKGSFVEATGARTATQVVEDISAISRKALEDKLNSIRARAIARATVKFLIARLAEDQASKHAGQGWGKLAGIATRMAAAATEIADTRCWATIPAEIRMARLRVPPGRHSVTVQYVSSAGAPVSSEILDGVEVATGKRTYVAVRTAL